MERMFIFVGVELVFDGLVNNMTQFFYDETNTGDNYPFVLRVEFVVSTLRVGKLKTDTVLDDICTMKSRQLVTLMITPFKFDWV